MRLLALLLTMSTLSAAPDLLRIPVKDIEGKETTLGAGKPRAVLVVNVASECGYTRQYAGLQDLHEAYKSKGLVVAGFPCNDFGGQEPGDEKEIRRFCSANFKVTFAMFSKVRIKGDAHPLYEALTSKACGQPGPVAWNFAKFLIGADGKLIARYDSGVEPDDARLRADIEKALK
ncbi:MAG: glutathione peroxidase [Opitutia bacterium]